MNLQRNTILNNKYIIISCLGQGGFGITYKARRLRDNMIVCVKEFFVKGLCFRENSNSNVQVIAEHENFLRHKLLFTKEAKTLMGITHPNIIKVLDDFEENNTAYYVMEYIEGESLANIIPSNGMPETEAVNMISQLCTAIGFLHKKNITHLDIKPANILISDSKKLKLIDFGGSKRYSEWGEETSTSPTAASEGFAPIELYHDKALSKISTETDIYEIGATLYNMVSGKTPPSAWNLLEENLPLNQLNISSSVARAIYSAMRPHRQERCHDVNSFTNILFGYTNNDETNIEDSDITIIDDSTLSHIGNDCESKIDNATAEIEVVIDGISKDEKKINKKYIFISAIVCLIIIVGLGFGWHMNRCEEEYVESKEPCEIIEDELSQYVESANNLNSFTKQSIIHIDSLVFNNKRLIFYVTILEEGRTIFEELQTSDAARKQYLIAGLRGDKKLYERCQQLIQIEGSLCYIYRYGKESVEIILDSSELANIEPYTGTEEGKKTQKYSDMAHNISNQCPSEVDDGITMTSCEFENNSIIYRYDCTSEAFSIINSNLEEYKFEISQKFMNDKATEMFVDMAGKDSVSIVYEYKKKKTNSIIKLTYNTQIKKFI